MHIETRSVDSVFPYARNPRQNDGAVDAVAKSIQEFGFRQPIVVDGEGVIVVGHTRWKAAKKLGLTQVPVHVARDLSPEKAKAYRLADNQTATIAEWDKDLLPLELLELKDLGIDLSILGWTPEDLGELLAPVPNDGLVDPDDIPSPPAEATTNGFIACLREQCQTGRIVAIGSTVSDSQGHCRAVRPRFAPPEDWRCPSPG